MTSASMVKQVFSIPLIPLVSKSIAKANVNGRFKNMELTGNAESSVSQIPQWVEIVAAKLC